MAGRETQRKHGNKNLRTRNSPETYPTITLKHKIILMKSPDSGP